MRRASGSLLAVAALALAPAVARADSASDEAEKKFDEGVKQMDEGKYSVACPLLAESYRLEPLAGALFTLAECESKWGKMASALGHYEQYLALYEKLPAAQKSKQGGRAKVASSQIEALVPEVPEITLVLPAGAPADVLVKRDDVAVQRAELGKALRVDPGDHVFVVETVDGRSRQTKLRAAVGEKRRLELALPEKAEAPPPPPEAPPPEAPPKSRGSLLPITISVGVVGLGGVAVGAVTGLLAMDDKSTADAHCPGLACDPAGKRAVDDGRAMGLVSTIGFIAGGVCLAAAVVLFALEPKKHKTTALVLPGGALVRF